MEMKMKHTKQDYIKILTRYNAFGDCNDFDTLISMIGDEFKKGWEIRSAVLDKSQKLENFYNDYGDADDRDKFFDDKYKAIK